MSDQESLFFFLYLILTVGWITNNICKFMRDDI